MKTNATRSDILDAIRTAVARPPDDPGVTAHEYADAEGITRMAAESILTRGLREGKLLKGMAMRPLGDGRCVRQIVYRPAGT